MSYDIVYEQLALQVPCDDVKQQAYDFLKNCVTPTDELKENQLTELKTQLSDLNPIWQEQMRFDEPGFNVEIAPKSVFEMWLFQQLITGYQDRCWFNGSEPPSFAVKKLSI